MHKNMNRKEKCHKHKCWGIFFFAESSRWKDTQRPSDLKLIIVYSCKNLAPWGCLFSKGETNPEECIGCLILSQTTGLSSSVMPMPTGSGSPEFQVDFSPKEMPGVEPGYGTLMWKACALLRSYGLFPKSLIKVPLILTRFIQWAK